MLASTADPALQDSTSFDDKYQQDVMLEVVTCTRDRTEDEELARNPFLGLIIVPLTLH